MRWEGCALPGLSVGSVVGRESSEAVWQVVANLEVHKIQMSWLGQFTSIGCLGPLVRACQGKGDQMEPVWALEDLPGLWEEDFGNFGYFISKSQDAAVTTP